MIVVVGVDASDPSLLAVRRAVRYAEDLEADLHAVHVAHVAGAVIAAMGTVPVVTSDLTDAERAAVWERIGPVLDAATVSTKRVDLEGYPPDALIEYAERVDADLLVVGSRGRGDLASLLLGSVSHRVVNRATCDVLVARKESQ